MDRWMDRWEREGFFYFIYGWMDGGREAGREGDPLDCNIGGSWWVRE